MQKRLDVAENRMHVVHMGVDLLLYTPSQTEPSVPTIGYLSRMCAEHGLEILVDAFILLKANEKLKPIRLRISGGRSAADEPFIQRVQGKLAAAGVLDDVDFLESFDRHARLDFLQSLSVLSVPEPQPVAYGLYVLEALAMGVPVVEPAIGCFPETIEMTGGGVLYEPNTAERLAEVLTPLLVDGHAARKLGAEGREGVRRVFDVQQTAGEMLRVCEHIAEQSK
jgi:glycosyltransferase involved in cell wall biosynthesis